MKDNIVAVGQNKRARGEVLNLLYSVYPAPIEARTITNSMIDSGYITGPEIDALIEYLADDSNKGKGPYISVSLPEILAKHHKGGTPAIRLLRLTPRGVDLIEGTITDPGIDV